LSLLISQTLQGQVQVLLHGTQAVRSCLWQGRLQSVPPKGFC
jgi:hypothetical protein